MGGEKDESVGSGGWESSCAVLYDGERKSTKWEKKVERGDALFTWTPPSVQGPFDPNSLGHDGDQATD